MTNGEMMRLIRQAKLSVYDKEAMALKDEIEKLKLSCEKMSIGKEIKRELRAARLREDVVQKSVPRDQILSGDEDGFFALPEEESVF